METEESRTEPDAAAALFAEFLERHHADGARVEEWCARHPEHAPAFRTWWSRLAAAGEVRDGAAAPDAPASLGPYRILREIGRGGQAVVYLAEDARFRRRVALKMLAGSALAGAARLERFRREAALASRIDHPGVCTVHDAGTEGDLAWIAMRYVDGETLAARIAEARDTGLRAVRGLEGEHGLVFAEEVCRALHAAHEARLIHRDIKPRNVMIDGAGRPVLLDFGLARDLGGEDATLTATGDVFGTPHYMAPEQVRGEAVADPRADVWALGATLYETFTLRRPFEAPTREALFHAILDAEPEDARRVNPELGRDLAVIIATALAKEPDRRYQSALAFAEDLRRARTGEPVSVRPPGPWRRIRAFARRRPALATALVSLFVILGAALAASLAFLGAIGAKNAELEASNADFRRMADVTRLATLREDARRLVIHDGSGLAAIDAWLATASDVASRLPAHRAKLAQLRARAGVRDAGGWRFADAESRWEHDTLARLVSDLEDFAAPERGLSARVRGWRAFSESVRQRTLEAPAAAWAEAVRSIADAGECPRYGGLRITPQLGLVPIGRDRGSGLWEFAHLQSGTPPARAADGSLAIGPENGVVLALVPGGRFRMGAVRPRGDRPRGSPNVDPEAQAVEGPPVDVRLDAFFLSKYEMTQAQWMRIAGANPSGYPAGETIRGFTTTLSCPVENLSWEQADEALRQFGLVLPTECQWEYAARAGTTTTWWPGDDARDAEGAGNVADAFARSVFPDVFTHYERWLDDGFVATAPVGSFRANAFGLHDVLGNVAEWCRDRIGSYEVPAGAGDGERRQPELPIRVVRGGSWRFMLVAARSACRAQQNGDQSGSDIGVRPARALTPAR